MEFYRSRSRLFSDPTLVSTVTVDEDGQFSAEFLVDALASPANVINRLY